MLREIKKTRQHGDLNRRWFTSPGADLYVWSDHSSLLIGFEYCYKHGDKEHALRWKRELGYSYAEIDDGEFSPFNTMTPILIHNGEPNWQTIIQHFSKQAGDLDAEISAFILNKLNTYGNTASQ